MAIHNFRNCNFCIADTRRGELSPTNAIAFTLNTGAILIFPQVPDRSWIDCARRIKDIELIVTRPGLYGSTWANLTPQEQNLVRTIAQRVTDIPMDSHTFSIQALPRPVISDYTRSEGGNISTYKDILEAFNDLITDVVRTRLTLSSDPSRHNTVIIR